MKVTILGSGCWEGTPAPFCQCRICRVAAEDPTSIENRTRPEIRIEHQDTTFLLELSPDLRIQSTKHALPPIRDYVVSHWHFDHLFGLYELHAWIELVLKQPVTIYGSEEVAEWVNGQFGFIPTNMVIIRPFESFRIGSVTLTPFPVRHMYTRDEGKDVEKLANTFGYVLEADGKKIAYLADYYAIPQRSLDLIKQCDSVIADGTYLFEDIYPDKPYQQATLQEHDADHLHGKEITDFTTSLGVQDVVYHSITHLPEKTHDELQALLPQRHRLSYDGMSL